jgi:hypothetical protein
VNLQQLETDIRAFVRRAYPNIEVRVEPWTADPKRPAVYFTEAQFASLYPTQRYHYLRHLIPADCFASSRVPGGGAIRRLSRPHGARRLLRLRDSMQRG